MNSLRSKEKNSIPSVSGVNYSLFKIHKRSKKTKTGT